MPPISAEHMAMLKEQLTASYVPHIPPLLNPSGNQQDNDDKNLSRSFNGYVISKICSTTEAIACGSIVDDYGDIGIDAIFYDPLSKTLYFEQGKLKIGETFTQEEAQSFCRGVRKLIQGDFTGFNTNVTNRQVEICGALELCEHIQLVVAHTGAGIAVAAQGALNEFHADRSRGDGRVAATYIDYDSSKVVEALLGQNAFPKVDSVVNLETWNTISAPRTTYFGLIPLADLIDLHNQHGEALYEKNIRTFLGRSTDVNIAIRTTLDDAPQHFVFFNNGVTLLCTALRPTTNFNEIKRLELEGISVINGAQTIASAATFTAEDPGRDISSAKVSLTIVHVPAEEDFGELITQARNHQNAIFSGDFVALDSEQERLRREIAFLGVSYFYKAVGANRIIDENHIYVDDAAQGLACANADLVYPVLLKRRPSDLLDRNHTRYRGLFDSDLKPAFLVNSHRINQYVQGRMNDESRSAASPREQATYRNGNFLVSWILMKRVNGALSGLALVDDATIRARLSVPLDELRQILFDETENLIGTISHSSFFKNQTQVTNLAKAVMIRYFGINVDAALRAFEAANPDRYISHLASRAPQIDLS